MQACSTLDLDPPVQDDREATGLQITSSQPYVHERNRKLTCNAEQSVEYIDHIPWPVCYPTTLWILSFFVSVRHSVWARVILEQKG